MEYAFIYVVSLHETRARYRGSHTDLFYLTAEETHWIYTRPHDRDTALVCYIRVPIDSPEYRSAIENHHNTRNLAVIPNDNNIDSNT